MVRPFFGILLLALVLMASADTAFAVPQQHATYMKNEEYSSAYAQFSTIMEEAKARLDAAEFVTLEKEVDKVIAEDFKLNKEESGLSDAEAYAVAYSVQQEFVNEQLIHDWLRKHPVGIQGFYRLKGTDSAGYMTVQQGDAPNTYAVRVQVALTSPPYDSGELEGEGSLVNSKMVVTDMNDDQAKLSITFSSDVAKISTTTAFKASGFTGDGVVLDGEYGREKK